VHRVLLEKGLSAPGRRHDGRGTRAGHWGWAVDAVIERTSGATNESFFG
jgi:hypothetical protein